MPINPSEQAASLLADVQEISPVEQQNRYGIRHQIISNLPSEKVITILAVQTPTAFSADEFFAILTWLRETHGIESMQTAFSAQVPGFGSDYRNDLHLTAHLRVESAALANA